VGFVFRAVALVAVLLLVGCGGGGSADDASPATIVPADAVVYGEMVVRPEGSLRSDALDAAAKVFATDDPEARIRELLREASGRSIVDSERDVEPWLGDRVGFWGSAEHAGVVLLAADDPDAARESVEAVLRRGKVSFSSRSHGGVDYLLTSDGVAAGIVDGWLAIGASAWWSGPSTRPPATRWPTPTSTRMRSAGSRTIASRTSGPIRRACSILRCAGTAS
jgi:hypothetical protein